MSTEVVDPGSLFNGRVRRWFDQRMSATAQGWLLGMTAAIGYSVANLALRDLSDDQSGIRWSVWVSATKAIPTALAAWLLVGLRYRKGLPALPPASSLKMLLPAALLMQFGGNLGFQVALEHIGLAATVPLVFASILVAGAVLGRLLLNDPITVRTSIAMLLMVASIVFLSVESDAQPNPTGNRIFGAGVALISGGSYGTIGVIIRKMVTTRMSISATLVVFSTTGLVALGPLSVALLGVSGLAATTPNQMVWMAVAGTSNAVAFFALTGALTRMANNDANLINGTQIAICAAIGILYFGELFTGYVQAGLALTIAGLLVMERR